MLFGKKIIQPSPALVVSERISVSLKTLINLVGPAASLSLQPASIRSRQNGGHVSRFKGRGMEFDETRLYQPGDDIRSIDWRVTARTGKTHTKLFREERERPVFIAVDDRAAMHFATRGVFKSVLAAKLAGLLAWTAQHHGDRMGGQIFSDNSCRELKPQNGRHAVLRFLNALTQSEAGVSEAITLEHAWLRLSQHVRPGSLVYIISDFRGVDAKAESHLAKLAQHCDVVLIFIYDPLESSLPSSGRYRFTDEQREVIFDANDQRQLINYQQHFEQRLQQVQELAKKKAMMFVQCSTTDDPIQALRRSR
ncbi:MAG: DUF58 domain-containing protein [Methylobacter sp.]|nr:MAG: DUF58 domain-containing protein [Methylobacter sp.]